MPPGRRLPRRPDRVRSRVLVRKVRPRSLPQPRQPVTLLHQIKGVHAVAQIPDNRFVVQPFRGSSGPGLSLGFMGIVALLFLSTACVQAQSTPTSNSSGKNKPAAGSPVQPQEVDLPPVVPPPPPATVEQTPPQPPTVAWDGKLLTIDGDNATLAAVLIAVRERTGASIEIPGAAAGERVFVHLGPGPARDVISSLVYGTPFDYIVETAEDDPDTLRKVVLTARGLGDTSTDVVVAGATNAGEASDNRGSFPAAVAHRGQPTDGQGRPEGMRMMKGWASSGKTAFQADAEAALAAQEAAKEQESAAQESVAQESAAAQESSATQESAPAQDAAPAVASGADAHGAEDVKASNDSASAPSTSESDDQSGVSHAIQNMTRMFEQRRQIQALQNQPPPPPSN